MDRGTGVQLTQQRSLLKEKFCFCSVGVHKLPCRRLLIIVQLTMCEKRRVDTKQSSMHTTLVWRVISAKIFYCYSVFFYFSWKIFM